MIKKSEIGIETPRIFSRLFGVILVSLQAFASAMVVISVARLNILKEQYIWLIVGVMTTLLALTISQLISEKSKKAAKITCAIVSLIITAVSATAFYYTDSVNNLLDRISSGDAGAVSEKDLTREPFIVYLSGSDARHGLEETARSDVNMVMVVNPEHSKILLLSIPRDTYVQLHGTEGLKDKLTHAGLYGVEMSKTTIEDFLNIKIDHTVKVSFDAIVGLVDELDGIEIYSDAPMHLGVDYNNKKKYCDYYVGYQTVDGDCALRFARERKTYLRGDMHRGENQQQVITSIVNKLSNNKGYVVKLPSILDIIANSFKTTFTRNDITDFIRMQLDTGKNWQVESIAINGVSDMLPTYSIENEILYVMHAYPESITEAQAKIAEYLESMF